MRKIKLLALALLSVFSLAGWAEMPSLEISPNAITPGEDVEGTTYTIANKYVAGVGPAREDIALTGGLIFNTNQTADGHANAIKFDVKEGFEINTLSFQGYANSDIYTVSVTGVWIDGWEVDFDPVVFPEQSGTSTVLSLTAEARESIIVQFATSAEQVVLAYAIGYYSTKEQKQLLYFTPNEDWLQADAKYAAYYFSDQTGWFSDFMTPVAGEQNLYKVHIPNGFNSVIFVRCNSTASYPSWNAKWNQTVDLAIPTTGENHFTIESGSDDNYTGSWSKLDGWDEILFTQVTAKDETNKPFNDTVFKVDDSWFKLQVKDIRGRVSTSANNCKFGNADGFKQYTHRLTTGGSTEARMQFRLSIPEEGKLRLAVRTGSSADTTRYVAVEQDGQEVFHHVLIEENEKEMIGNHTVFKYHYVPVSGGVVYLTCFNSIQIYSIAFQPGAMPEPEPEPCEDKFGIMLDNDYIAGARNEAQTEYKEFVINNVRLTAGQSLQLFDSCNAAGWIINAPEYAAAGYEFNVVENKWVVSQTGSYTLYIKFTNAGDQLFVAKNIPQWEEIAFTAEASKGALKDSVFTAPGNRFSMTVTDVDSKIAIDGSVIAFGTAAERTVYEYRFKTGGKSSAKNVLTLNIPAQGLLRLAVRTGSNSDTTRTVNVIQNDSTLFSQVLVDSIQKKRAIIGEDTISYYQYYYTYVKEGTAQLTYPIGSINFYALAFLEDGIMPDPEPEPQPVETVTYYAVNTIGLTAPYAYVWDSVGGEYVAWPGVAMTPINQEFRGYPIYAVTVPANMTNMVISENGSEYIKTTDMDINPATPYMYLMEWYASLDDVPSECSQTFGILVGENFIAGRQTEASQYLEYMIVAELEQGDHFKFYENCTKSAFAVAQEEGGYWFNYDQASDDYVAPATGTYTIYLKLYGVDNNVIWTSFEAPIVSEWDEITFSDNIPVADFTAEQIFYSPNRSLTLHAYNGSSKMAVDESQCRFGLEDDFTVYTHRIKTGAKSKDNVHYMTLNVAADGLLRIAVRSASSTATDRTLLVKQNDSILLERIPTDNDSVMTPVGKSFPYSVMPVKQGTVVISFPVGALNFYSFGFKEGEMPVPPTPVDSVTYYAVNTIGLTAPYAYVWDSVGGEYVAWPGVAMTPINQEFRGYPIYAVTVPANMTNMIISENGNQAMKTKDMALDPAKPYMYLMLWYASLDEIPGDCTQSFGILMADGRYIAGELNESAEHMEYIITAELNANDSIKFYESCTQSDFFVNQEEGGYWFIFDRENEVYIAPATGTYTIYLKLYAFDNRAIYTSYQEPIVPPAPAHYYIAGTMTDWQLEELVSASSSPEMYVLIPMSEDTVEHFKVVCVSGNDTIWYGNTGTMEYYNCTNWVFDSQSDNASIHTTEVGNYAFVVTINEQGLPVVSVRIPTPSTVEMITYYAVNSIGIQIPYAYVWNADGAYVQWPGVPMQPINEEFRGYPIYAVTVPVTMDSMVINANGSDQLKTPDMALDTLKPYMYNLEWYASLDEIPEECSTTFGILVNGETFIPGEPNDGQGDYRQFDIRADLQAGDQFVLYEYCTESPFMAAQEEGGWWFDIVENHFVANASASFTIYLKIYGYDNNVIFTVNNPGSGLEETLYNDGKLHKVVEDGIIVIYRDGKRYNLQGQALR